MTTYEFYRDEYGGTADEVSFLAAVSSAEAVLRALMYPVRPKNLKESKKKGFFLAVCEQVDYSIAQTGGNGGRPIRSETLGDHSVTYAEDPAGGVTVMGIAVSPEAVMLLEDYDCLSRWV